jgi:murein DD-endopeptidase MepM/ murein hydrolase activator NlpD
MLCVALVPVLTVLLVLGGQQQSSASCQPVTELPLGTSAVSAVVTAAGQDPDWSAFEAAEREQETGSAQGDYSHSSGGCQGAYCWLDSSIWTSMASEAGVNVSGYPTANLAPPNVQDAVFTGVSFPLYQRAGGGQAGYAAAAAAWNGGTTAVVSNPALGPGATNYSYANQVLAKMAALLGQSSSADAGGSASTSTTSASLTAQDCSTGGTIAGGSYANPLRGVVNLVPERIDQGVDYNGSGPVYAIGDGVVENVYNTGWPGGAFIVYRLSDGPDQGNGVYMAEDVDPAVQVGQQVTANTQIGTMTDGPDGVETGWADLSSLGEAQAMADHQAAATGDAGATSTGCGQSFDQLLVSLGAPGGIMQPGSTPTTSC